MSGPDREQVAEALFRWNTPGNPHFVILGRADEASTEDPYLPIADAVIALFAPVLQAARAEAWDEGAEAVGAHIFNGGETELPNPYRRAES